MWGQDIIKINETFFQNLKDQCGPFLKIIALWLKLDFWKNCGWKPINKHKIS